MKIVSTGYFFQGRQIGGWEIEDGKLDLPEDGRVLVNGVEIVPWSKARQESMKENSKGWVKA